MESPIASPRVEFLERLLYVGSDGGLFSLQIGGILVFAGRLDVARLNRALQLLAIAEPVVGCRFVGDARPPTWQPLDNLDSLQFVEIRESDKPTVEADAFVAEPFNANVDAQIRAALIHGPVFDVLAVKAGHLAMDGGGLKDALYMIAEFYRVLGEAPEWRPKPNVDGIRYPKSTMGIVEALLSVFRPNDRASHRWEWGVPLLKGRGAASYVRASVEPVVFRSASSFAKSAGATVNDVILTAFYRALYRVLQATPGRQTPMLITIDLRKHLPAGTKTAIANMSFGLTLCVSPVKDEEFDGTLSRVADVMRGWKRTGAGKTSAIWMQVIDRSTRKIALPFIRKMIARRKNAASKSFGPPMLGNCGVIEDHRLDFGSAVQVTDSWILPMPFPTGLSLCASTYRNRLHFTVGVEFAAMSEALVNSVVSGTVKEIELWVASKRESRATPGVAEAAVA